MPGRVLRKVLFYLLLYRDVEDAPKDTPVPENTQKDSHTLEDTRKDIPILEDIPEDIPEETPTPEDTTAAQKKKSSLNNLKTNSQVVLEVYRKNLYNPEEAEELLAMEEKYGQGWWKPLGVHLAKEMENPLCSAYPNRTSPTTVPISSHDFFKNRNIRIPLELGTATRRAHYYRYRKAKEETFSRLILDCPCGPSKEDKNVDALCKNGKISLSRGAGFDTSFFVHEMNSVGRYHVVAHIIFTRKDFKEPKPTSP